MKKLYFSLRASSPRQHSAMANLLLTLLPLLFLAASLGTALVQVNIDCGAPNPYTDKNGVKWDTDEPYTAAGESHVVKTTDTIAETIKTLRAFTSRKKNCYTVAVGHGGKVRLRATFYYGNYDGKSSPPSLELMVDGNDVDTVETSLDAENEYELIYVVSGESTSVCVAQNSPGQFPFVSAVQVWELDPDMYRHQDPTTALILFDRVAFGAADTTRYPDDAYDRVWGLAGVSDSLTILKSDTASVNVNITDQPPAAVLMTAVRPSDPTGGISLTTTLPPSPVPVYVNLYFADTVQLGPSDKRSFAVFMDGSQLSDPIVPDYASATEFYFKNVTASASTKLNLQALSDSTRPPIINAMEVFGVSDTMSNGTDAADVKALARLVGQFDALNGWAGDPCLPQNYSWDWVGCSSDDTPRVTALYLSGYGLSGELPDLSSMDALQTIDMSNNSIGGAIPDFLGEMPSLTELDLADNSLSGPIPSSLSSNKKIKLETSGNPNLCASGQSCRVISSPASSPGAKRQHASNAKEKSNGLGSFSGVITLCLAVAFVY